MQATCVQFCACRRQSARVAVYLPSNYKTIIFSNAKLTLNVLDKIQCGDSARLLRQIHDESVDLVVTPPPYFQQREYGECKVGGKKFLENYIDTIMDVFHECVRITKICGNIVFNMSDKYENGSLLLAPYKFVIPALSMEKIKLVNNTT